MNFNLLSYFVPDKTMKLIRRREAQRRRDERTKKFHLKQILKQRKDS